MTNSEEVSMPGYIGKTYVDPENVQVIMAILVDLKRKVAATEKILETMLQECLPDEGSQANSR